MGVTHCLDTNVLVYAFSRSPRDAAKARIARQWIAREDWGVTVQILQEFYLNAVRAPHDLRHALQLKSRFGIAYWDAAVIAGARRLGATILVSEDLADGQDYGGVRVLDPFASA